MRGLAIGLLVATTSCLTTAVWGEAELADEWEATEAQAPAAAATERAPGPSAAQRATAAEPGTIARSAFTTAVVDREPTDQITTLTNDRERVFFFTELRGFEGRTVTHRWEFSGEPVAEVYFQVGGPRWRVFSSKNLPTEAVGEWAVSIVDEDNQVLRTESFLYTAAPEAPAAPASAAKPAPEAPPQAPAAPAQEQAPAPAAMEY